MNTLAKEQSHPISGLGGLNSPRLVGIDQLFFFDVETPLGAAPALA
jgi:hypothetical protein